MNGRSARVGRWLVLVLTAGIGGCSATPNAEQRATPRDAKAQPCAQQVAQLQAWTEILLDEQADPSVVRLTSLRLVQVAGASLLLRHDEVSLELGASELSLNAAPTSYDQLFAQGGQPGLVAQLSRSAQQARALAGSDPTLTLLADERAPWRAVTTAGKLAALAGFAKLRFVFRGVSRLAPPGPSWLAEQARSLPPYDPQGPAPKLGEPAPQGRQLFDACPDSAARARKLEAIRESSNRGAEFAHLQAEFLRECACGEDPEAVRQALWLLWNRDDPNQPYASVVVSLGAALQRDSWMERVAPDSPWADAHKLVLEHARSNERFTF